MTLLRIAALAIGLLAAGCAGPRDLVVLVPSDDGHVGAVTVRDRTGTDRVLENAYDTAEVGRKGVGPSTRNREEIDKLFGPARAAQPLLPVHFSLYFETDSETLTPQSEADYRTVFQEVARRSSYDIEVIGHTDTTADAAYNRELSERRARAIADRLVKDGIPADHITASGRGESDLLVKTPDETAEPRNRRVAITVR